MYMHSSWLGILSHGILYYYFIFSILLLIEITECSMMSFFTQFFYVYHDKKVKFHALYLD